MTRTMKTNNKGNFKMLENAEEGLRYVFRTRAVAKSNLDSTVAYYEPIIEIHKRLIGGSTYTTNRISVEYGNALYKKLLINGFKPVTHETISFV